MSERRLSAIAVALLIVFYVGSYFATVQSTDVASEFLQGGGAPYEKVPEYRYGGQLAARLYLPIHYLDRHFLRPVMWEGYVVPLKPAEKKEALHFTLPRPE